MNKSCVLGLFLNTYTLKDTLEKMGLLMEGSKPAYVATVNTEFLINSIGWKFNSYKSEKLVQILREADIATADGMPLILLSNFIGANLSERVTGADLLFPLLKQCADTGKKVFFLGSEPSTLVATEKHLQEKLPSLKIVGTLSPQIALEETITADDFPILKMIANAQPDLLVICFGNPKQEMWFQRVKEKLSVPLSIGVGGTLNFLTARIHRAPPWMQKSGLEWIHRLIQEPKRMWKRYGNILWQFPLMAIPLIAADLICRLNLFFSKSKEFRFHSIPKDANTLIIVFPTLVDSCYTQLQELQRDDSTLIFDFTFVKRITPKGLVEIIQFIQKNSDKTINISGCARSLTWLLKSQHVGIRGAFFK